MPTVGAVAGGQVVIRWQPKRRTVLTFSKSRGTARLAK
jgi:hypothetical protein